MPVDAYFCKDGRVLPKAFTWSNGYRYRVRILDVQAGAMRKNVGCGTQYHIEAGGKKSFLFRFGDIWEMSFQDDIGAMPDTHLRYDVPDDVPTLDQRYDNPYKAQVEVFAHCGSLAYVEPVYFLWEDGRRFAVDDITGEVEKNHSAKAGIVGLCYPILVCGKKAMLYRSGDLWFMERKGNARVLDVHGRLLSE